MSLKWCKNIDDDKEYYILKNYDVKSLMSISQDLEKAAQEIKELQQLISTQYANATRTVEYKRIIARKDQNMYSKDKKVYIVVNLESYLMLEGKEVKSNSDYNLSKKFAYSDIKLAAQYIKELKEITKEVVNKTKYKQLDL
jgi:hypothetical protein